MMWSAASCALNQTLGQVPEHWPFIFPNSRVIFCPVPLMSFAWITLIRWPTLTHSTWLKSSKSEPEFQLVSTTSMIEGPNVNDPWEPVTHGSLFLAGLFWLNSSLIPCDIKITLYSWCSCDITLTLYSRCSTTGIKQAMGLLELICRTWIPEGISWFEQQGRNDQHSVTAVRK